jgi:hypothetical protein
MPLCGLDAVTYRDTIHKWAGACGDRFFQGQTHRGRGGGKGDEGLSRRTRAAGAEDVEIIDYH